VRLLCTSQEKQGPERPNAVTRNAGAVLRKQTTVLHSQHGAKPKHSGTRMLARKQPGTWLRGTATTTTAGTERRRAKENEAHTVVDIGVNKDGQFNFPQRAPDSGNVPDRHAFSLRSEGSHGQLVQTQIDFCRSSFTGHCPLLTRQRRGRRSIRELPGQSDRRAKSQVGHTSLVQRAVISGFFNRRDTITYNQRRFDFTWRDDGTNVVGTEISFGLSRVSINWRAQRFGIELTEVRVDLDRFSALTAYIRRYSFNKAA